MTSEQHLEAALERANPVQDLDVAVSRGDADALFASITQRRREMITDHTARHDERLDTTARRPWYRRGVVLVAAAVLLLLTVPAVAYLLDLDQPPLVGEFPPGIEELTVYGPDQGVAENCAWEMAFMPDGTPIVAGLCGLLEFDGEAFRSTGADIEVSGMQDLEVTTDGTVWIASVDDELQSVRDGFVTTHGFMARGVAVTSDGTVWANEYAMNGEYLYGLYRFDGAEWTDTGIRHIDEMFAMEDGSLRTLGFVPVNYRPEEQSADDWFLALGRVVDGEFTSERAPEGIGEYGEIAPDGSLWTIGGTGEKVTGYGFEYDERALVRYDGTSVTVLPLPFPEPEDFAIHPDGTVWATDLLYGLFSYDGTEWLRYSTDDGLPSDDTTFVEIAPNGDVYVGTSLGVARITPEA